MAVSVNRASAQPLYKVNQYKINQFRRTILYAAMLSSAATVSTVQAGEAEATQSQQATQAFNIVAGSLESALTQFSTRTGVTVSFTPDVVGAITSKGLVGNYRTADALAKLLQGTGLQANAQRNGSYTVIKAVDKVETLDTVHVAAPAEGRFGDAPPEPGGFKAEYQTTATKMAMSLKETPQAISVVTADSLEARQVKRLATAVELTPSVSSYATGIIGGAPDMFGGYAQTSNLFNIRGQNADVRTDGFKVATFYGDDDGMDIAAFERIEVVRGPAGFYGRGSLGGFINKVRKKPQADYDASISVQAGSFDTYRTEAGITGAINESESLRARLDFAYEDAGAFTDDIKSERVFLAPSFEATISDRTRILMQLIYQKDKFDANPGIPDQIVGNKVKLFDKFSSRTALYGSTGDKSSKETYMASITVNHELSDRWLTSLYLQGQKQSSNFVLGNYASVYNYGFGYNVYTAQKRDYTELNNWAGELRLQGSFDAFNREHQALFGIETNKRHTTRKWGYAYAYISSLASFDGDFGDYPTASASEIPTQYENDNTSTNHAIYGQFLFSVLDRTKILIGTRYDVAKIENVSNYRGGTESKDSAWTSRLGVIQTINDNINAYAIYAESFTPSYSTGRNGALDPETGKGYELGLKTEWFDKRLGVNIALYEQELDNRPIPDPTNGRNDSWSVSSGLHRTTGVELEINGSFYPGWTIGGAASWMDNEFTEDGDPNEGLSISGTVDKQFSLYTSYEVQQGRFKGLGMGATFVHFDDRKYIDSSSQVYLEGFNRLDLNFFYKGLANWDMNLLVRNVADEEYINSGNSRAYLGAPRAALFKATYHF